jgi:hypothetical protein
VLAAILLTLATCELDRNPLAGLPAGIRGKFVALQRAEPCTVEGLPKVLREELARMLNETRLAMAGPQEEWNDGCLVVPGQPRRQLLFAAHSGNTWLVHFQEAGFAVLPRTLVFTVGDKDAHILWSGSCIQDLPDMNSPSALVGKPVGQWECHSGEGAG